MYKYINFYCIVGIIKVIGKNVSFFILLQNKLGIGYKVDLSEDKLVIICLNLYYDMWYEIDVLLCYL